MNDSGIAYPFSEVSQVVAGGVLIYDPPAPTFPVVKKICFVMRSAEGSSGKTAKVSIMGPDAPKEVFLPAVGYYREYCLASSTLGQGFGDFNVKHVSGGPVNVLHSVRYIDQSALQQF